jgi:hypothetical protein
MSLLEKLYLINIVIQIKKSAIKNYKNQNQIKNCNLLFPMMVVENLQKW